MEVLRNVLKYTFGKLNGRTFVRLQVRIIYNNKKLENLPTMRQSNNEVTSVFPVRITEAHGKL